MIDQECQDRSGYRYAEFLLQEKQRELQALELRHSTMAISSEDYHSCRRSLLDAISQLEALLRGDMNANQPQRVNTPARTISMTQTRTKKLGLR